MLLSQRLNFQKKTKKQIKIVRFMYTTQIDSKVGYNYNNWR